MSEKESDDTSSAKPKNTAPKRKPEDYSEVIRNESGDTGPLAAFLIKPSNVKFDTQDSDEKILLLLRKHVVTNIPWILLTFLGLFAPIMFTYIPAFFLLPTNYQAVSILVWYLMVFGFSLEQFLSWYFHVYIITDERIIDYDFYSLLYKRVSKAKLDRVEDVTYSMGGILQNVFHYGTVFIQTAAEMREFEFEDVPRPELVGKLLNELMLEEERERIEGRVS